MRVGASEDRDGDDFTLGNCYGAAGRVAEFMAVWAGKQAEQGKLNHDSS